MLKDARIATRLPVGDLPQKAVFLLLPSTFGGRR